MKSETLPHDRQTGWCRWTTHVVITDGWVQGTLWARTWSGTEPLPVTWYAEFLMKALRQEMQQLEREERCPAQWLDELTTKLRGMLSHPLVA